MVRSWWTSAVLVFPWLPLPPRSTLFPYTTLFRSREAGARPQISVAHVDDEKGGLKTRDRKSTRLNSSHRCISYAVFCLKKKNRKHPSARRPYRSAQGQQPRIHGD